MRQRGVVGRPWGGVAVCHAGKVVSPQNCLTRGTGQPGPAQYTLVEKRSPRKRKGTEDGKHVRREREHGKPRAERASARRAGTRQGATAARRGGRRRARSETDSTRDRTRGSQDARKTDQLLPTKPEGWFLDYCPPLSPEPDPKTRRTSTRYTHAGWSNAFPKEKHAWRRGADMNMQPASPLCTLAVSRREGCTARNLASGSPPPLAPSCARSGR